MISMLYLTLIAGSCLAHYRGSYDTHNFIAREEPDNLIDGDVVECPVCKENADDWLFESEKCPIKRGNKTYKKCRLGTYVNEICEGRLDCYRGPGEQCTEKRQFDSYGAKCAPGYYCNKSLGVCTGMEYQIDSNIQMQLNRYPYTFRRTNNVKGISDDSNFAFETGRI